MAYKKLVLGSLRATHNRGHVRFGNLPMEYVQGRQRGKMNWGYLIGLNFAIGMLIVGLLYMPPLALIAAPIFILCLQGLGVVPKK